MFFLSVILCFAAAWKMYSTAFLKVEILNLANIGNLFQVYVVRPWVLSDDASYEEAEEKRLYCFEYLQVFLPTLSDEGTGKVHISVAQLITVQCLSISWSLGGIRGNSKERLSCANKESLDIMSTGLRSLHHSCSVYFLKEKLIKVKHEVIRANPPGLLLACCLLGYSLNQTIFTI